MKAITFISLFALLCVAFSNSLWSAELDTVWVSDYKGEIKFQHPITKNLLLRSSISITELDSKDGRLVSTFDLINEYGIDLSPDGSKILSNVGSNIFVYEYPNMQIIETLNSSVYGRVVNDSEIVYAKIGTQSLFKYNLTTKKEQILNIQGICYDIATSPDGRFIAISTEYKDGLNDKWSRLTLLDAKTMTQIALLEEVKNTGHNYLRMNFSHDGKYLTTNSSLYNEDFQRNIYNTETLKPVKNYNPLQLTAETVDIKFINNYLYCIIINNYDQVNFKDIYTTKIIDIQTNKTLLTLKNVYGVLFNSELNHLFYRDIINKKTICLNLNNLITGETKTQMDTVVSYQNKILTIKKENIKSIEISDISGRIILNKINDSPISNNTILPINLANGAYLINITTDKESFTHKLLVLD